MFSELHRLGGMRHYAAQVKHERKITQGKSIDDLLTQVRQAFARPFKRAESPRECYVSQVYIFNSGEITPNAVEQFLSELARERFGDNVHFLDGRRLEALNEWATLQSDANTRARLIGLRAALRFIIADLRAFHLQGQAGLKPVFIHGVEMYMSEPVNCSDEFLVSLFKLWQQLQGLEALRQITMPISKAKIELFEKMSPTIKESAQEALALAIEVCQRVEAMLETMRPLE